MADSNSIILPPRAKDLTGQRFGRLVALRYAGPDGTGRTQWVCECDCGVTKVVAARSLPDGNTRSCGCLSHEDRITRSTTHGMYGTPEYRTWGQMLVRCYRVTGQAYRRYGGRGITVCSRWRKSFAVFFEDVGFRPSTQHSIDRIDNEKNYEPGNVRWATRSQQARNRRNNRLLTFQGETKPLVAWAEEHEMAQHTLSERLRHGWTVERALTEPVHH